MRFLQKLNRKADEEKIEPNIVARDFLRENNYFENKDVIRLKDRPIYRDVISDIVSLEGGN